MKYLPEDALERIKAHKYSGSDNSLLYKYILSPVA